MTEPLVLNVQDNFVIDYYQEGKPYNSYISDPTKATINGDTYLAYRFIASGGKPPYIYELIGNAPPSLGLVNFPRSIYYNEYADLTLVSDATFTADDSGIKNVSITCKDTDGQSITVNGVVNISRNQTFPLTIEVLGTGIFIPDYISEPILGLTASKYAVPRHYYKVHPNNNMRLTINITGTPKGKPYLSVKNKPSFLSLERPDVKVLTWILSGRVEDNDKPKFYGMQIVVSDGATGQPKDVYPAVDLMFYTP